MNDLGREDGWHPAVHQAVGMIAIQIGAGVEEAANRLAAEARLTGESVESIAREVVAGSKRFAADELG